MWSRERKYMKKKSNELRRLERNRKSVFYELDSCMNCGSTREMSIHEIFLVGIERTQWYMVLYCHYV